MFQELDSYRTFNIIDDILVEETIRNAEVGDNLTKMRTALDKAYTNTADDTLKYMDGEVLSDIEGYIPGNYADSGEEGFMGVSIAPMQ